MSADFWSSSQRTRWQLTRSSLLESRRKLLLLEKKMVQNGFIKDYPNISFDYNMRIYLHTLVVKLGRRLNIRQIALATAEIYLTRFLTRVSLKEINVYLLVTTCVYVACKMEECPQHIRLIISEARNLWPEYIPQDVTKLAEFEFYLIEEMESFLFLHHPYRSLLQIKEFLEQHVQEYGFVLSVDELQNCWSLINDSYITDLHMLFPPHIIAIASIYITVVLKKNLTALRVGAGVGGTQVSTHQQQQQHPSPQQQQMPQPRDKGVTPNTSITNANTNITSTTNTNSKVDANITSAGSTSKTDPATMPIDDLMALANSSSGNLNKSSTNSNNNGAGANKSTATNGGSQITAGSSNSGGAAGNVFDSSHFQDIKLDEDTIKINKFMNFLSHSHINLDEVVESMQDMINLYVVWNRYNENSVRKALQYMLSNR